MPSVVTKAAPSTTLPLLRNLDARLVDQIMDNKFAWVDLSTFHVGAAKSFYQSVFGWNFPRESSDSYSTCLLAETPCAGLYEMPEFFQKIKMPSFWMSYIAVENVKTKVDKAKELGGKIELEEQGAWGKIALIRDPAGAGFTCYEGSDLRTEPDNSTHGRWYHNELFVSDISLVTSFYEMLFDWRIKSDSHNRYLITDGKNSKIASIQVATNDVKGDKEFWAVYFAVDDLLAAKESIKKFGGSVSYEHKNAEGTHLLAYDDQGASFFLTETNRRGAKNGRSSAPVATNLPDSLKWKSFVGLLVLYLVMLTEQQWGYGLFWLFWAASDIKRGSTYFFDLLDRRSDPVLYWAVILTWLFIAGYFLV